MKTLILAAALAAATTCSPLRADHPVTDDGGTCAAACTHYRAIGCDAGKPTPLGATCEDVCGVFLDAGLVKWDLKCRSEAPTCEAVEKCEVAP